MTKFPKVSVVTITYGHENYIKKALDGVLMQDYPGEIEYIIANDNSPDNTDRVIKEYFLQKAVPSNFTIEYTNHESNKGMMPNFMWSIKQISGQYVAFCEGDDYWIDTLKLRKQVKFLEQNREFGLIATDFNMFHQSTGKVEHSLFKNQPKRFPIYNNFEDFLLAAGYMAPCTWVLRKEYLPEFKKIYVDGTFPWLLDVYLKSKVYLLPDTTTVYRYLEESASHTKSIKKRYELASGILDIQLDYVRDNNLSQSFRSEILKKHYKLLLPILVAQNNQVEIENAKFSISNDERSTRDNALLMLANYKIGRDVLRIFFYLKGIKV